LERWGGPTPCTGEVTMKGEGDPFWRGEARMGGGPEKRSPGERKKKETTNKLKMKEKEKREREKAGQQ